MLERGGKVGDYTLVRFLGRGQFGVVWLAEKEIAFTQRKFRHALKFLPSHGDEKQQRLIQAEIDTWIAASGHPNVMSVLDMLVYDDHIVIASEFADSGSLMDWMRHHGGKAPSTEKALEMMNGILSGMAHLHSRNVVHRDLKPDNILLQGNTPRITDFGISRIVSAGSMSAVAMGSPTYMSPESFDGGKTRQTDIWSAGVILYEMLTGGHPYRADTIYGLVTAIREQEPRPLPESVPLAVRQIVEAALQKDLTRRYRSANDMRSVVEQEIYNLKVRFQQQVAAGVVDPTAITLFDAKLDLSELDDEPQKSIETATLSNPNANKPTGTQDVVAVRSAESVEIDTRRNITGEASFLPAAHSTSSDLRKQIAQLRRPAMVAGGVGSIILVVVVGFVSFVMAAKWIVGFSSTKIDSIANTTPAPPPVPAKPKAPEGMVYVEGGGFTMGRNGGMEEEGPAFNTTVGRFFIDVYEVTNEKYAEFVQAVNYKAPPGWKNGRYPAGEGKLPVVGVTWDDATAYAGWAGKRLPSEKEWEYAARGSDGRLYPWGHEWEPNRANADGASIKLADVGVFNGSSPSGLFDMVGNAAEWTQDDFKAYGNGTLSRSYAGKRNLKTVRGNGFDAKREFAHAVYRFGWAATGASDYSVIGFRCAKDIGQ